MKLYVVRWRGDVAELSNGRQARFLRTRGTRNGGVEALFDLGGAWCWLVLPGATGTRPSEEPGMIKGLIMFGLMAAAVIGIGRCTGLIDDPKQNQTPATVTVTTMAPGSDQGIAPR